MCINHSVREILGPGNTKEYFMLLKNWDLSLISAQIPFSAHHDEKNLQLFFRQSAAMDVDTFLIRTYGSAVHPDSRGFLSSDSHQNSLATASLILLKTRYVSVMNERRSRYILGFRLSVSALNFHFIVLTLCRS